MKQETEKRKRKINEIKSWSFEKINNIDKLLAIVTKKIREDSNHKNQE